MQNEKNLTPEEVRSVITSRERKLTPAQIKSLLTTQLQSMGFTPDTAPDDVYYKACASIVRRILKEKRRHFMADCKAKGRKQTYYLCMEFLLGRSLKNSIYNLNLSSEFSQALKEMGVKMENLFELEPDAGLGNGGLGTSGRLLYGRAWPPAAIRPWATPSCTNSASSSRRSSTAGRPSCPTTGCPAAKSGWSARPEHAVDVNFGGRVEESWDDGYHHVVYKDYTTVKAVPYDMYDLRLRRQGRQPAARSGAPRAPGIDMDAFNQRRLHQGLWPETPWPRPSARCSTPTTTTGEGKSLRLRQQYFLVRGLHLGYRAPPHGALRHPGQLCREKRPSTSTTPIRPWPSRS